jgi:hypothetical protein
MYLMYNHGTEHVSKEGSFHRRRWLSLTYSLHSTVMVMVMVMGKTL